MCQPVPILVAQLELADLLRLCGEHGVTRIRLSDTGEPVEIELMPKLPDLGGGEAQQGKAVVDPATAAGLRMLKRSATGG